ncbi:hypothetical protein D0T11_06385 [Hymenobacter rubripertinctus]|uniref:Uncharacterized protein n=1 Tax=Hymenobacter rubripertinctus TaxID=2029981 RepID=A0A418R2Y6_9BACT|nr:hypothetical protein D0T11_06385 [Hymenobacter rubripertinctus]
MGRAAFVLGATITERPGREREIELSRPDEAGPWRLALPGALDQRPVTAKLVKYVATCYFEEAYDDAKRVGWLGVVAVVWVALARANGEDILQWGGQQVA